MKRIERIAPHRALLARHDISLLADAPTVYHCHHFNLFWDQTIDDALGAELGARVRTRAAREAFHDLLSSLCQRVGASTPSERLEIARDVFSATGQGTLRFDLGRERPEAATVAGEYLHYGYTWSEKYGGRIRRRHPADGVAAGFAAAAMEVAYALPRESASSREHTCVAMRDATCSFEVRAQRTADRSSAATTPLGREQIERVAPPSFDGQHEVQIASLAGALRDLAATMSGDDRGLIQAFGLFVTQNASTYYNRSGYDAYRRIARDQPGSLNVMRALLREAGHVCVFNTFGGILLSPEWEALVGRPSGDPVEVLVSCCAIGRALGMGHWTIETLEPQRRFVMRSPGTYESLYYASREPRAETGMCCMLQGAVLAMMQLAHRFPWNDPPALSQRFYDELFREGIPWQIEETQCLAKGDAMDEFVVQVARPSTRGRLTV